MFDSKWNGYMHLTFTAILSFPYLYFSVSAYLSSTLTRSSWWCEYIFKSFSSNLCRCTSFTSYHRRCAIFLASFCAGRRFGTVGAVEYHVRRGIVVVLVHNTSRISIITFPEQYRSLSVPNCSRVFVPLGHTGGISAWIGLQRGSSDGAILFHVGKSYRRDPK